MGINRLSWMKIMCCVWNRPGKVCDFCSDYFQVCQCLNDTNNPGFWEKGMMLYVSPFRTNLSSWQSGASCAHSLRVIVWQERFSNYGFRLLFSLLPCHLFNCLYLHISRLNFKVSSLCYFHSVVSDNESRQMRAQNQALRCNTEPSL